MLLCVIFCSELGYYFYYNLQQIQIKRQVKKELLSSLPESSFVKIELDKNIQLIEWEEEGKEFYLDGQLYDVQKKVIQNGKTILYCLNDIKEQQLLKEMANATKPGCDKQKSKTALKITLDYCLIVTIDNNLVPLKELQPSFFYFNETALAAAKEITVPPPRV